MSDPVVKISEGIYRLPTVLSHAVNSFVLIDDDGKVVLIDAGLKGSTKKILAALDFIGKRPEDVKSILLSHAHVDHLGGVNRLNSKSHSHVCIHEADEKSAISGIAPKAQSPLARAFSLFDRNMEKVAIDSTFKDEEILNYRDGLLVVHTPGHTPGHVSFYDKKTGTLITGDALFNMRDKISFSLKYFCTDFKLSKISAQRLGDLEVENIGFMHGREILNDAQTTLREFLKRKTEID